MHHRQKFVVHEHLNLILKKRGVVFGNLEREKSRLQYVCLSVETLEIVIISLKLGICLGRVIQNVCLNLDCPSVGKPDSILVVLSFVCLSVGTLIINIVCTQFFLSVFLSVVFGNL